ncbi:dTDP-glucose 4,6-dehydratase [Prochlorococcus marinus]|uniref:dTDP-glucose 4,6-dehydratase n=1 Tax=Prochlorococcus marinus TaxID=1219 RepID=UPI0022B357E1|nr:dTDP-glucose 4,6-dehydratase [Prochlorococcus marinus]
MISFPEPINRILVTGGSGFIGGTLVRRILKETTHKVFNLDKLSYASNLDVVNNEFDLNRYQLLNIDLANKEDTKNAIDLIDPDIVFHLAAESHVDRSILGPRIFLEANMIGTFNLLESVFQHWESLELSRKDSFRFIHVSTDEVFGSLGPIGLFSEDSPYKPSSPYSATKAASDHLVKSWFHTYGLPTIITNSSNNFGAWQLPEKLIPVIIMNAISQKPIPIYGDGKNIRDWIYVEDHIDALLKVALNGRVGDSYCIGANQEKSNEEIVELICELLDSHNKSNAPHSRFKVFVKDRPGHDRRYAIDNKKIIQELDWCPKHDFSKAILITIEWYLSNLDWCKKHSSNLVV